ncbi:hypothetical protein KTAU_35810 [Thermogemmatispora aurantia]|uniref:Uncharacterized protein n=1 Tax=Thermogemmatispora aurantia TaxID=2045279 RepID=A0A5J4KBW2_9CHLR|nr:hypothetical protein KTAU_35810 [Thermogemmatispora aurantia]
MQPLIYFHVLCVSSAGLAWPWPHSNRAVDPIAFARDGWGQRSWLAQCSLLREVLR